MKAEQRMEQIIEKKNRMHFYNYYLSLGYDRKVSACLALFTYGDYRFKEFSMDSLYNALSKGEEYLPPEEMDKRERMAGRRVYGGLPYTAPAGAKRAKLSLFPPRASRLSNAARPIQELASPQSDDSGGAEAAQFSADLPYPAARAGRSLAEDEPLEEMHHSSPALPLMGAIPDPLRFAGAMGYATDEYEHIEEKDARNTAAEPTSTFRMTTNTASAGVVLNQLRNGRRISRNMVRIEEMLNYFRYESKLPVEKMFHLSCEIMDSDDSKKYLYINVQGREEVKERQNIVILLDVSGSMDSNTEQTQAIIATIISKLGNGDKLSLITYSDDDIVELEAFTVNGTEDRVHALEKLLSIEITGCTYGSKGIEEAYRIGKKNYIPGGNNQVILITDGDLNFGITDKSGLEELIEKKKKDNLFLSVIGTGLYNYKDDKLEVLSKHGNGVYRTVNSLTDVQKSVDEEYTSLVNIIAKDVKAQVEFNPEIVEQYRLLGFENRALAREDFTNDKVISEPFGSGGWGVALYELKTKTGTAPADSGLKYSRLVTTGSPELGTVKVRYKEPLEDNSHELEKVIESSDASFTDNLRLAFIVYVCAEKLRGSDRISDPEISLAKKLYAELGSSIREKNASDLYKLAGILDKSEKELGVGIPDEPFPW